MLIQNSHFFCIIKVAEMLFLLQVNCNDTFNNGYKDNQLISIEKGQVLKCSYLLYALKYMRIARLEINHPNFELNNAFYPLSSIFIVFQKMISTLFGFDGIEIGSLWLVLIYLGIVSSQFNESSKLSKSFEHLNTYLKDTHDYVIDALDNEVSIMKCNIEKNQFYVHEEELNQLENELLKDIYNYMVENSKTMASFILKNTNLSITDYAKFTIKNILIKNIGGNGGNKINYFINECNVQVNWEADKKSTMKILQENYENAHKINWRKNKLKCIQIYYDSVFRFFKIIILRLTWKHFLYVKKQENESTKKVLIKKWVNILNDFVTFFHLKTDDYVFMTKTIIGEDNDINDYLLKSYLNTLCLDFGCNALEEMKLDGKEFSSKKDILVSNETKKFPNVEKPVHNETELKTVEFYSLGAAEKCVTNIKKIFSDKDFNVIKSLIDFAENNNLFIQIDKKIEYLFSLLDI